MVLGVGRGVGAFWETDRFGATVGASTSTKDAVPSS